LELSSASP
jgi:hypothetical protein